MSKSSPDSLLTIGQVVEQLRPIYPDLSISKIRYLEEEGLIRPRRSKGGYRKFGEDDLERIELILKLQKEKFLPLSVIRQRLRSLDMGQEIPELKSISRPKKAVKLPLPFEESELLSAKEIAKNTGLKAQQISKLETYRLLKPKETQKGKAYTPIDLEIANLVRELERFGIEPRHLHIYSSSAEREAAFFEQVLMPVTKHKDKESKKKAAIALSELLRLFQELRSLLLKRALHKYFHGL